MVGGRVLSAVTFLCRKYFPFSSYDRFSWGLTGLLSTLEGAEFCVFC